MKMKTKKRLLGNERKLAELAIALGIICIVLAVSGCASSKPNVGDIDVVPGPDESVLVISRGIFGFANRPLTVYVDGTNKLTLKTLQTGRIVVPNGEHELLGKISVRNYRTIPKKISVNSEEITFKVKFDFKKNFSGIITDLWVDFIQRKKSKLR
jgi:hypothetical protein